MRKEEPWEVGGDIRISEQAFPELAVQGQDWTAAEGQLLPPLVCGIRQALSFLYLDLQLSSVQHL